MPGKPPFAVAFVTESVNSRIFSIFFCKLVSTVAGTEVI